MEFKYFFVGVFFTLFVVILSVILFNIGRKSVENHDMELNTEIPTRVITPTTKSILKKEEVEEEIKYYFLKGNFDGIEKYLTNVVIFRYEDDKKLEKISDYEIVEKLDSLKIFEISWNFDQESDIVKSLEATYPENYSNSFISFSDDYHVFSFQFNEENNIYKISFSESYKDLLD